MCKCPPEVLGYGDLCNECLEALEKDRQEWYNSLLLDLNAELQEVE